MDISTSPRILHDTDSKVSMKTHCENQQECMKMIQAILDGEATAAQKDHFKENMDRCMPCINTYHLEKCVKDALQVKVPKKICPDALLVQIKDLINR